jgi:C-terminal processing protease CtpA/Prc
MADFRTFLGQQSPLTAGQRITIIDQAEILVRDLYVHLPLKRAMHAVDPVQRLRLLRHRASKLSDREFHAELLDIFLDLRDLHTNYVLPDPYRGRLAFIGVLLEQYVESGEPRWMVSKVFEHLVTDATLQEGATVTHWNGMPMELAVWRNAEREAGSNQAASYARGLENMTFRSLAMSLPPDEDWVDLRYEVNGNVHETRLEWRVFDSVSEIVSGASGPEGLIEALRTPLRYHVGVDLRTELVRRAKKQLFAPGAIQEERRVARFKGKRLGPTQYQRAERIIPTTRPDDLTAREVDTDAGTFGYLRLWTFHMRDGGIEAFILEVMRLLEEEFPSDGLIIDVRGNGGGYIIAAEFLLQLLTPERITPEPTQFVNTPATLDLTRRVSSMGDWKDSISQAIETGAQYSEGIPLSPPEVVNQVGQIYHGPVVLITDALCYSACDMFAAGFQDHGIGKVIGVDANTGAGGANVVSQADLRQDWTDGPLEPLPAGASMRVSLRRTLRVSERAGQPVEDLGVIPDILHEMTRDDLLDGNRDLLNRAGEELAQGTVRVLSARVTGVQGRDLELEVTTRNVPSLDAYVNGRPQGASQATPDGTHTVEVRLPASGRGTVRLEGFARGKLVAARLIEHQPA